MLRSLEDDYLVAVARAAEFKTRQPVNTDDVASTLNLTEDQGYDIKFQLAEEKFIIVVADALASVTDQGLLRVGICGDPPDREQVYRINSRRMLHPICADTAFKPIAPPGYWDTPPPDPEDIRRLFDNEVVLPEALVAQEVHHHDHHYYGPTNAVNVAGSVEVLAVGDHAAATTNNGPSTDQFKAEIAEIMQSLIRVQEALDNIDERIFDSLNQFLVVVRKMQIEGMSGEEVQLKMKDTLDDIWVRTFVSDMKLKMPPGVIGTLSFLLKNVIVGPLIKAKLGL